MDEKKETQGTEKDNPAENTGKGVQSETDKKIAELDAETERLNRAIAENENAKARARVGGLSDAGQPKLTAEEEEKEKAQKLADEISTAFK